MRKGILKTKSFKRDDDRKDDATPKFSSTSDEANSLLKFSLNDRKAEEAENDFKAGIDKESQAMEQRLKKFLEDDHLMNSHLREEQINSSHNRSRKKISPAVLELLEAKKRILSTLWEDSETNWAHRETFTHSNFNDDAHKNFENISKETMRVFEIRWLDLRIKGLIEQRENSLRSLKNICQKSSLSPKDASYVDIKTLGKILGDEIVLFRTVSLYIIEYIETWKAKQTDTDRETYIFEESDYVLKMATDLKSLIERFPQLYSYLEEKELNAQSPLALPKNPRMYFKYYGTRKVEENEFEDDNQSMLSKTGDESFFLTALKKTDDYSDEDEEGKPRVSNVNDPNHNKSLRSITSNNTVNILRNMHQEIARKAPQSGSFGRVQHFSEENTFIDSDSAIDFEEEEDENQAYNRVMSADKRSDISVPKDILERIQVQMQLPTLLVNQAYSDRTKRHKKYTEPLISIRHEDLLEQLEKQNPLNYKDLMERDLIEFSADLQNNLVNPDSLINRANKDKSQLKSLMSENESNTMEVIQSLDEQMKVHNIDLTSTKKVLLKRDKLIQKLKIQEEKNQLDEMYQKALEEERASKAKLDILRKRHVASAIAGAKPSKSQNTDPSLEEITNPKIHFAPPDPIREMRRLALAEKHIYTHERISNSHYYQI